MLYHIVKLLDDTDLSSIVIELMKSSDWIDGASSAVGRTKEIKRNIQLSPASDVYKNLNRKVCDLIVNEMSVVNHYIFPKKIINLLFSRTSVGMYYGKHIDLSLTPSGRRDYSFTLFLSNPNDYEGGELLLDIPPEQKSVKLEAGNMVIYPTKYLHEVKQVTSGERVVCVGWIESLIKNDDEREILGNIKTAMFQVQKNDLGKGFSSLNLSFERLKKYFGD